MKRVLDDAEAPRGRWLGFWLGTACVALGLTCCGGASSGVPQDASQAEAGLAQCLPTRVGPVGSQVHGFTSADLPKGACSAETSDCEMSTVDPCPPNTVGRAPTVAWRCTCSEERWQCRITGTGKSACVPQTDASIPEDAGATQDGGT